MVGDSELKIRDIVSRWPGSSHDQTIFSNSRLQGRFESNEFGNAILLGDSGYGLKKYLITPVANPRSNAEQLFNEAQIRTRNPIERLFGVVKRRFPILSLGIRVSLDTAKKIIVVCAILHNLAIDMKEPDPVTDPDIHINNEAMPEDINVRDLNNAFREEFIIYFTNLLDQA